MTHRSQIEKCFAFLAAAVFASHFAFCQTVPPLYEELKRNYDAENFEACVRLEDDVEALAHARRDTVVANSFRFVGEAHYLLGETNAAIRWFERERALRAELGLSETDDFSGSLYNLATLYLEEGNYSEAGGLAEQLIANDRKLYGSASEDFVSSMLSTIDIFFRLDKLDEAEKLLLSTVREQPKNSLLRGVVLSKLADLYTMTSQYSKATRALNGALDIIERTAGENSVEFLSAVINLGILQMGQGKFAEAEETFDFVLTQISPERRGCPTILHNEGLL